MQSKASESRKSRARALIVAGVALLLLIVSGLGVWAYPDGGVTPRSRDKGEAIHGDAAASATPVDSTEVSAIPARLEDSANQPHTREEPPKAMVSVVDLSTEDRARLAQVDEILSQAGRQTIPSNSAITVEDLEAFRAVVDKNRAAVSAAERSLTKRADALLANRRQEVVDKIAAGVTEGLPLKGPNNRLRRRHPYEAITEQEIEGKRYVIRVHPSEDPQLAKAGEDYSNELKRQLFDCDSLVRVMFVTGR